MRGRLGAVVAVGGASEQPGAEQAPMCVAAQCTAPATAARVEATKATVAAAAAAGSTHLEHGHERERRLGRQLLEEEEAQQEAHQLLPARLVAGARRVRQGAQHLLHAHALRKFGEGRGGAGGGGAGRSGGGGLCGGKRRWAQRRSVSRPAGAPVPDRACGARRRGGCAPPIIRPAHLGPVECARAGIAPQARVPPKGLLLLSGRPRPRRRRLAGRLGRRGRLPGALGRQQALHASAQWPAIARWGRDERRRRRSAHAVPRPPSSTALLLASLLPQCRSLPLPPHCRCT